MGVAALTSMMTCKELGQILESDLSVTFQFQTPQQILKMQFVLFEISATSFAAAAP